MTALPLSDREKFDRLRLLRSENVGPVTFARLLQRYGTAGRALAALPDLARRGGRDAALKVCSVAAAERELQQAEKLGAVPLWIGEPDYPPLLTVVTDSPPLLYVRGHRHLLTQPVIAMVGARNASAGGRQIAWQIAADLGQAGWIVASGLARGIDTAAHEGSLQTGTIAVMAGGVDVVYPPENAKLHAAIAEQGVLVSEMPPGTEPQARHFPRRNRIISGLARGVLVVEATVQSGSLITARMAGEQNREVMAVPGSPLDGRSEGPNSLIRDGAALIRSAADVIEAVSSLAVLPLFEPDHAGFSGVIPLPPGESDLDRARALILPALGPTAVTVDEIIRQCQLSASVVMVVLLELELAGRLERQPGNRVALLSGYR